METIEIKSNKSWSYIGLGVSILLFIVTLFGSITHILSESIVDFMTLLAFFIPFALVIPIYIQLTKLNEETTISEDEITQKNYFSTTTFSTNDILGYKSQYDKDTKRLDVLLMSKSEKSISFELKASMYGYDDDKFEKVKKNIEYWLGEKFSLLEDEDTKKYKEIKAEYEKSLLGKILFETRIIPLLLVFLYIITPALIIIIPDEFFYKNLLYSIFQVELFREAWNFYGLALHLLLLPFLILFFTIIYGKTLQATDIYSKGFWFMTFVYAIYGTTRFYTILSWVNFWVPALYIAGILFLIVFAFTKLERELDNAYYLRWITAYLMYAYTIVLMVNFQYGKLIETHKVEVLEKEDGEYAHEFKISAWEKSEKESNIRVSNVHTFNKIQVGDSVKLNVYEGLFQIPYIKTE